MNRQYINHKTCSFYSNVQSDNSVSPNVLAKKRKEEEEELMKYCEYMECQVSNGAIGPSMYMPTHKCPKELI